MTRQVRILGDGVAARCSAHLLHQAGYGVEFGPSARSRVPVIMIGESAEKLICDVFGRANLFQDLPRIGRRIVAWGGGVSLELPHSAVTISEEELLSRLGVSSSGGGEAAWTIHAANPIPASSEQHCFGTRMASPVSVRMKPSAPADACWIESLKAGWLFMASGWLAAVGANPVELLAESKLVAHQIDGFDAPKVRFPVSPRMASPLGGDKWIACGSAAMGFDPLCGDGTAHAVREAILATAVIRAGGSLEVLAHYEARLTAGFERHLRECRQFYASGGDGPWWREQVQSVDEGLAWCGKKLAKHGPFRYRLNGLQLERVV